MRVIAGSARGRTLLSPAGNRIRPTADRVKEALFSSLGSRFGALNGLAVLDLFAGSGALGIEALSRGAASALFVDNHPDSLQLVRKNLELTGLAKSAEILRLDVLRALTVLQAGDKRFDIIFADPPYADQELAGQILLAAGSVTTADGIIVLETDRKADLLPHNLMLLSKRIYGDTAVWLFTASA
ncbi:MAG: methyltransferase [Deltaproteobacteria bacterium]|nr:methyltransferase [Deltaproteobacteria bacterium]